MFEFQKQESGFGAPQRIEKQCEYCPKLHVRKCNRIHAIELCRMLGPVRERT